MINLLLGAPGGGKSYEAVAHHIIPALNDGRMVITNLPLNLDAFAPEQRRLVVKLEKTTKREVETDFAQLEMRFKKYGIAGKEETFNPRPFSNQEDYGNPWRHPDTGAGPLYVIDECHLCLPRSGTQKEVAEWFSLHRHEFADVLLITQSHGKVCKDIVDLVQVCYRVRKGTAFGFSAKYIRKVFDGVNGEVVNEGVRTYDKKYFKYYRSHTKSSGAGEELQAKDITPIWKRWPVVGALLLLPGGCIGIMSVGNPFQPKALTQATEKKAQPQVAAPRAREEQGAATNPVASVQASQPSEPAQGVVSVKTHPLQGYGVHINGYAASRTKAVYMFSVSQNGQAVFQMNNQELLTAGYEVEPLGECVVKLKHEAVTLYALCDSPRIGSDPGRNIPKSST